MSPLQQLHELYKIRLAWADPNRPAPPRQLNTTAASNVAPQPGQARVTGRAPTCRRCGWSYNAARGCRTCTRGGRW